MKEYYLLEVNDPIWNLKIKMHIHIMKINQFFQIFQTET